MKFERHIKPYESLKVGLAANPIELFSVSYNLELGMGVFTLSLLDFSQIMQLLRALEIDKDFPDGKKIKRAYSSIEDHQFYYTEYTGSSTKFYKIQEIIGKYVKFHNYLIFIDPKLDLTEPIEYEL